MQSTPPPPVFRQPSSDPLVEAAAQTLHAVRHPAGYGHTCGQCRHYAEVVAMIYKNQITIFGPTAVDGWMAARDFYGTDESDGGAHGAECAAVVADASRCTCDRTAQHEEAIRWERGYKQPDFLDSWMGQLPRK